MLNYILTVPVFLENAGALIIHIALLYRLS